MLDRTNQLNEMLTHISVKGLISRIYNKLLLVNNKKTNNLILKCAKVLNKQFSEENIQITKKHEKMLNITSHQKNANQNHNEITPHT